MTSLSTRFLGQPRLTKPIFRGFGEVEEVSGLAGERVEGVKTSSLPLSAAAVVRSGSAGNGDLGPGTGTFGVPSRLPQGPLAC